MKSQKRESLRMSLTILVKRPVKNLYTEIQEIKTKKKTIRQEIMENAINFVVSFAAAWIQNTSKVGIIKSMQEKTLRVPPINKKNDHSFIQT